MLFQQMKVTMEKLRKRWKGKLLALFLFLTCFFFFNWPLLSIPSERGGFSTIIYLFLLWLLFILCLWFYCRNEADQLPDNQRGEDH